jgi:hypothetical protein
MLTMFQFGLKHLFALTFAVGLFLAAFCDRSGLFVCIDMTLCCAALGVIRFRRDVGVLMGAFIGSALMWPILVGFLLSLLNSN